MTLINLLFIIHRPILLACYLMTIYANFSRDLPINHSEEMNNWKDRHHMYVCTHVYKDQKEGGAEAIHNYILS